MIIQSPASPEALGQACQYINGVWHAYNPHHLPVIPLEVVWQVDYQTGKVVALDLMVSQPRSDCSHYPVVASYW